MVAEARQAAIEAEKAFRKAAKARAKVQNADSLTATGKFMGTLRFMAPENFEGRHDVRSDIYSLGVIFFELLTGEKPFKGGTAMGIIYKHARAPIPLLPTRLSEDQSLLNMMLAKDPEDRLQSVAEVGEWL